MFVYKNDKTNEVIVTDKKWDLVGYTELIANSVDAAKEKHVPALKVDGDTVCVEVGEVLHPMQDVHYIQFVVLETYQGFQIKYFKPSDEPKAVFKVVNDKPLRVYEYCNLHGLWVKEI